MISGKAKKLTVDEYLRIERKAEFKSDFYNGEMFALAGASLIHNKISSNIHVSIANQLKKKLCDVFQSDLKIREETSGLFTYPDIVVICSEPGFYDKEKDTILNPTVIMEILSKSTEGYDRGFKFEIYRRINSLKDYLMISQEKISVEHFTKNADGSWTLKEYNNPDQSIPIVSIDCILDLISIYTKVEFENKINPEN